LNSVGLTVRRHWRLITFIICLLLFIWIIWHFISVILPFIIGLIIAYLLLPVVRWLERHLPGSKKHPGAKRISIIIVVYFVGLVVIAGLLFYIFTVVNSSASLLFQNLPQFISGIITWIQDLMAKIRLGVPASMLQQYDETLANAGVTLVNILRYGLC
jgi:predicted PurR-regulated permease PerM